jgi:galactose mutarotase-like enzyme
VLVNVPDNPSGESFEIAWGDQRAVVTEVGATLRQYVAGDRDLIEGFKASEMCSGGRGQLLLPWPNRIRDGSYEFGGRRLQLPLSEPERHHASHGLVRWTSWRPCDRAPDRIRLELVLHPQPGYPFQLELGAEYSLSAAGLRVALSARNGGDGPAPFGAGSHPYLKPSGEAIDGGMLWVPARSYLEVDERLVPTGRRLPVAGTPFDFRQARPLGDSVLDTCFADLEEPAVEFDGVRLSWDDSYNHLQLFTGDTLSADRRRRGLAVEAMSCPADAFNSHQGLVVLEPGGAWRGSWTLARSS